MPRNPAAPKPEPTTIERIGLAARAAPRYSSFVAGFITAALMFIASVLLERMA